MDIPDDIRKIARKIAKEAVYCGGVDWAADDIGAALLAERLSATERAAKIVFQHFAPNQGYSMDPMAIDAIRAIRSQP